VFVLALKQEAAQQAREQETNDGEAMAKQLHSQLGIDNDLNPPMRREAMAEHLAEEWFKTKDKTHKWFDSFPVVSLLRNLKDLDNELKEVKWLMNEAEFTVGRVRPSYRIIGDFTGSTSTHALIRESSSHDPLDTEIFKAGKWRGEPKPVRLGHFGFKSFYL